MKVLVLNTGSATLKYALYELPEERRVAGGIIDRIGGPRAQLRRQDAEGERSETVEAPDHAAGCRQLLELLAPYGTPDVIGHRVVHGGTRFSAATRIDEAVLAAVRELTPLAPLHNPVNLAGIEAAMDAVPGVPQVAVFDTAFHQDMPEHAWRYAVPEAWLLEHGVRRYGFHGTSVRFVSRAAARFMDQDPEALCMVVLHLGSGASATAVKGGRSVDTSMGLSTLDGLVMGTRCGDLDPAVPGYIAEQAGLEGDEVDRLLHEESGLKGLCGDSDMREVEARAEDGDARADMALQVFCHRVCRHVGALAVGMGRLDALVFTGGIGEHSAVVRARVCAGLGLLGIGLDEARNSAPGPLPAAVQAEGRTPVLVVATDEELEIARQAADCLD